MPIPTNPTCKTHLIKTFDFRIMTGYKCMKAVTYLASITLSVSSLPHSQSFPGSTAKCKGSILCSESVRGITTAGRGGEKSFLRKKIKHFKSVDRNTSECNPFFSHLILTFSLLRLTDIVFGCSNQIFLDWLTIQCLDIVWAMSWISWIHL